jgi:hypothetical protein
MKKFKHLAAVALLASVAVTNNFAQNNLGEDCGCPPVSQRDNVELSTLFNGSGNTLTHDAVLTCNHNYIIRTKLYVYTGSTLTINPGTVIKGAATGTPTDASALVVMVGAKIMAAGTESCPIVFTAEADNLDGNYPICNRGQWGGLVLLGKAPNNLIVGNVYSASTTQNGIGFIEGYDAANPYNHYGAAPGLTDENDNSGILRYVSIRHAGAVLQLANELNGLSLGSVGRGTTIDHIEILAADDDNVEFFGGTVNVKYITAWWGADDMFDYDLGWNGNAQFLFSITSPDRVAIPGSDNGFEADGDDDKRGNLAGYMSHPTIYNTTLISDGAASANDFSGPSAIRAKERTEGEIYNSVFANFKFGLDLSNTRGSLPPAQGTTDAYQNWIAGNLVVKNNTFVNMTDPTYGPNGICISTTNGKGTGTPAVRAVASASDLTKFTGDGNTYQTTLPGFDYVLGMTCGTPGTITHKFDAVPNPEISSSIIPPANGFFTRVSYRGAFGANEKSWLSGWTMGEQMNVTRGLVNCPTDVNSDGKTDGSDYLDLVGSFGFSCQ